MDVIPQNVVAAAEADETKTISYFSTRLKAAVIGTAVAALIVGVLIGHFA